MSHIVYVVKANLRVTVYSLDLYTQVVTGEYSWVDAAGTRHVTEYRADETGYHIVDIREEKNFVKIRPGLIKKKKQGSTKAALSAVRAYRLKSLEATGVTVPAQVPEKPRHIAFFDPARTQRVRLGGVHAFWTPPYYIPSSQIFGLHYLPWAFFQALSDQNDNF